MTYSTDEQALSDPALKQIGGNRKVHQITTRSTKRQLMKKITRHRRHRHTADLLVEKVEHMLVQLRLELLEALRREFAHSALYAMPQVGSGVQSDLAIVNPQLLQASPPFQ